MVKIKKPVDKVKNAPKKNGRPTLYCKEMADKICHAVATNPVGLPTICKMFPELPTYETINQWRWKYREFSDSYADAKRFQAEIMAESCEDIILDLNQFRFKDKKGATRLDAGLTAQARIMVDTRKWQAGKLAPKVYGDKVRVETASDEETEQLKKQLKELRQKLAEKSRSDY